MYGGSKILRFSTASAKMMDSFRAREIDAMDDRAAVPARVHRVLTLVASKRAVRSRYAPMRKLGRIDRECSMLDKHSKARATMTSKTASATEADVRCDGSRDQTMRFMICKAANANNKV